MKRIFLYTCIFLYPALSFAREKIKGYFIGNTGDTMHVTFLIPVYWGSETSAPAFADLQSGIKYLDANGKKVKLKPQDAREVVILYDDSATYRLISVKSDEKNASCKPFHHQLSTVEYFFLKLEVDGPIRLFLYYQTNTTYSSSASGIPQSFSYDTEKYILQKNSGCFFKPSRLTFRDTMKEYLADCTAITAKIESKEYKFRDIERIVKDYNSSCGLSVK